MIYFWKKVGRFGEKRGRFDLLPYKSNYHTITTMPAQFTRNNLPLISKLRTTTYMYMVKQYDFLRLDDINIVILPLLHIIEVHGSTALFHL